MPNFNILSWNIQKFGEHNHIEAVDAQGIMHFVRAVARSILITGADLVGIMEIVSNRGDQLVIALRQMLDEMDDNVNPQNYALGQYRWMGITSERQSAGTREQYIYMWKHGNNHVLPAQRDNQNNFYPSFKLVGILGDNDLDDLIYPLIANPQPTYDDLKRNLGRQISTGQGRFGYVDSYSFQFNIDFFMRTSQGNGFPNRLNAPFQNIGPGTLRQYFLRNKPVLFPATGFRPPFVGQFTLNQKNLSVALLHAPGPDDARRYEAINNMADVPDIANATNGIIMGDFNIDVNSDRRQLTQQTTRTYRYFEHQFRGRPRREWVYAPVQDANKRVFESLTDLSYVKSNDPKTSIGGALPANNQNPQDITTVRSSTYDKFFIKSAQNGITPTTVNQGVPQMSVMPFIDMANQRSRNNNFHRAYTQAAKQFFNHKAAQKASKYEAKNRELQRIRDQINASLGFPTGVVSRNRKPWRKNQVKVSSLGHVYVASGTKKKPLRASKFKTLKKRQQRLEDELAQITRFSRTALGQNDFPQNLEQARHFYKEALSDHLPVRMNITA